MRASSRFLNVIVEALYDSVGADRPGDRAARAPDSASAQYPHLRGDHLDPIELRGADACAWGAEHLEQPTYARRGLLIPGIESPKLH
ncbi:MAG TPA: hypothetical protein PKA20_25795 [Burkholderiaceae bacterium]|nr:hypothetical protein [Burkholderiaceae bacterium]